LSLSTIPQPARARRVDKFVCEDARGSVS
jgi:hypothetical protein